MRDSPCGQSELAREPAATAATIPAVPVALPRPQLARGLRSRITEFLNDFLKISGLRPAVKKQLGPPAQTWKALTESKGTLQARTHMTEPPHTIWGGRSTLTLRGEQDP